MMQDSITLVVETRTSELQREAVRLRGERAAIEDRLEAIDAELGELEIAVRVYRRFANGSAPATPLRLALPGDDEPDNTVFAQSGDKQLPDLRPMSLADAVETVLKVYGDGARSGDIRRILVSEGKIADNRNSSGYLLKILREKPERFVKDASGRWGLRHRGG